VVLQDNQVHKVDRVLMVLQVNQVLWVPRVLRDHKDQLDITALSMLVPRHHQKQMLKVEQAAEMEKLRLVEELIAPVAAMFVIAIL